VTDNVSSVQDGSASRDVSSVLVVAVHISVA